MTWWSSCVVTVISGARSTRCSARPRIFVGSMGSPLFLAKRPVDVNSLLKLGADPFVCDTMGRNALFANLWEPESENNFREDPRDRYDSEVTRDQLGEYLKFAGKGQATGAAEGKRVWAGLFPAGQGASQSADFGVFDEALS